MFISRDILTFAELLRKSIYRLHNKLIIVQIVSFLGGRIDGNNLTSNLFTLITLLTTHKNTSDICSYKPYTEKKNNEKKMRKKYTKTVRYVH